MSDSLPSDHPFVKPPKIGVLLLSAVVAGWIDGWRAGRLVVLTGHGETLPVAPDTELRLG